MIDYSNESIQFDCFRGCAVVTDEQTLAQEITYRRGCCKLEVYDYFKGDFPGAVQGLLRGPLQEYP